MPRSYSWIEHGTSESGAQGINGAWVARVGFILFGLAVVWLTGLRYRSWGTVGTALHLTFAVSMFGVAAFSTRPWDDASRYVPSEDLLHSVFATTMGIAFIGGVGAVMIARQLPNIRAAFPDIAVIMIASVIPLTTSTDIWGLLQRIMFLTAAAWYARELRIRHRNPRLR